MKPIYKSLALEAMTLQVSLTLNAETRDDESASTMALQADLLDSLRVELVALNVSGARDLIESGECVIDGSNLTITLDTSEWTHGAMYRVQLLATFGTQTQVIYALNVTVPYYVALSDGLQEFSDNVTIVSTITDVTEADLEGFALEATSQEIKAAITPISLAAEAYNVGKTQLAQAITSKGVETSPTESYPEMAEKVNAISQVQYDLSGSEVYASTLYGGQLHDIIATAIAMRSRGDLVGYDGMIIARYYRGYASIVLNGASGYVCSDEPETVYTESGLTHVWQDEDGQYMDRYIVYLYRNSGYGAAFTSSGLCPRDIVVLGECGSLTIDYNRLCHIYCPTIEGMTNSIGSISIGNNTKEGNWGDVQVIDNLETVPSPIFIDNSNSIVFITLPKVKTITGRVLSITSNSKFQSLVGLSLPELEVYNTSNPEGIFGIQDKSYNFGSFVILDVPKLREITGDTGLIYGGGSGNFASLKMVNCPSLQVMSHIGSTNIGFLNNCTAIEEILLPAIEDFHIRYGLVGNSSTTLKHIYLGYTTNDKAKTINIDGNYNISVPTVDIELKQGFCKPLVCSRYPQTEETMYAHILQRLKQDEPDCGDGVTITLGATNLAKLTSAESVQLLDDLTNIYGYTFA